MNKYYHNQNKSPRNESTAVPAGSEPPTAPTSSLTVSLKFPGFTFGAHFLFFLGTDYVEAIVLAVFQWGWLG